MADRETIRDTIRRHTCEIRYLDPTTAQVYQAVFLLSMAITLLVGEVLIKMGGTFHGTMWIYSRWPEIDAWSAFAGTLATLMFLIPSRSNTARYLMWLACCYWFAFSWRMWLLFGWLPLASTFALVLALLAAWAYVRRTAQFHAAFRRTHLTASGQIEPVCDDDKGERHG